MTTNPSHKIKETEVKTPPTETKNQGTSIWTWIIIFFVVAALILTVLFGIRSRTQAEAALETSTQESAIPFVNVIHPKSGSAGDEIKLPGNTQAFTDTPIYARTSGYLKKWYFDIGARVKQGQLLAEIETPEIDQQLQQAQADLKNAQANLQISQVTAGRYQDLLKGNSVFQTGSGPDGE